MAETGIKSSSYRVSDIITFGEYHWRILELEGGGVRPALRLGRES